MISHANIISTESQYIRENRYNLLFTLTLVASLRGGKKSRAAPRRKKCGGVAGFHLNL